jgi:NhaP-type Na+/H+ or K+/H+ antiporter
MEPFHWLHWVVVMIIVVILWAARHAGWFIALWLARRARRKW